MKTVIYKSNGVYYTTSEENYKASIQNARAIQKCDGFESAEAVIDYYCKYCRRKPEDFIVIS